MRIDRYISIIAVAAAAMSCGANRSGYDAEGYFESVEVTVSSEANGRILSFGIDEGDRLEAGETAGCIDSVQLYLTRQQLLMTSESVLKNRPDVDMQVKAMKEQLKTMPLGEVWDEYCRRCGSTYICISRRFYENMQRRGALTAPSLPLQRPWRAARCLGCACVYGYFWELSPEARRRR